MYLTTSLPFIYFRWLRTSTDDVLYTVFERLEVQVQLIHRALERAPRGKGVSKSSQQFPIVPRVCRHDYFDSIRLSSRHV